MSKYIDADLLRKEIERLKNEYTDIAIDSQRGWVNANSVIDDLEQLQSQIDSLQQEQQEVDLEKEIERVVENYNSFAKGSRVMKPSGVEKIARYFYELGLKARKEEQK